MTGGTRAAALAPRDPSADWVKPQEGGEGGEAAFWGQRSDAVQSRGAP